MPLSKQEKQKQIQKLLGSCKNNNNSSNAPQTIDLVALRRLAQSKYGLVNRTLRKTCWPLLLSLPPYLIEDPRQKKQRHGEEEQVAKDVSRTPFRSPFPRPCNHSYYHSNEMKQYRKKISQVVNAILARNPSIHYYQGFHDLASVLLLITNQSITFSMLNRLSVTYFRECMRKSLQEVMQYLDLLFPLISLMDKEVHQFLVRSTVQPYFAVSWVLTWYSHDLKSLTQIARLFDFFLSSHPMMSLYSAAALLVLRKEDLLKVKCDFCEVHSFLSKLPTTVLLKEQNKESTMEWMEEWLAATHSSFSLFPPLLLQSHANFYLPANSMLKQYPYAWQTNTLSLKKQPFKLNFLNTDKSLKIFVALSITAFAIVAAVAFDVIPFKFSLQ